MPHGLCDGFAGGAVPQPGETVRPRRQKKFSVAAEGHGIGPLFVLQGGSPLVAEWCLPEPNGSVERHHGATVPAESDGPHFSLVVKRWPGCQTSGCVPEMRIPAP